MKKKINILGVDYKIKVRKLNDMYGECDTDKKVIVIDSSRGRDHFPVTLTHEVIHAVLWESGLTHILGHTAEGLEEAIVRSVEHGLTSAGLLPSLDGLEDRPRRWPPARI